MEYTIAPKHPRQLLVKEIKGIEQKHSSFDHPSIILRCYDGIAEMIGKKAEIGGYISEKNRWNKIKNHSYPCNSFR